MRFTAVDDGASSRCCSSAPSTCSRVVPKGFIPERGHGPLQRADRGDPGHRLRRDGRQHQAGDAASSRAIRTSPSYTAQRRRSGSGATSNLDLKPRDRAHADRPTRSSRSCGRSWRRCPASACLPARTRRRSASAAGSAQRCTSSRCRTPTPPSCIASRRMLEAARCATSPGLEDVTADLQIKNPQVARRPRSRPDCRARPDRRPGRDRAVQRLRHAAGLADLRAEQPVPGDPAGRAANSSAIPRRCRCCTCTRAPAAQLIPLSARRSRRTQDAGPLTVNHTGQLPSVTISFNLKPGVALGDAVARVQTAGARRRCRRRSPPASRARRRRSRTRCRASADPA